MNNSTPNSEEVRRQIKKILVSVLDLSISPAQIADDDPLFDGGLGVDSVEALAIVSRVQEVFGIAIPDDEIGLSLFQNVRSLADVVEVLIVQQEATLSGDAR